MCRHGNLQVSGQQPRCDSITSSFFSWSLMLLLNPSAAGYCGMFDLLEGSSALPCRSDEVRCLWNHL